MTHGFAPLWPKQQGSSGGPGAPGAPGPPGPAGGSGPGFFGPSGDTLVQAVAVTPGWTVIGAFWYTNDNAASPFTAAMFEAIALVSNGALVGRVRLFDVTDGVEVASSILTTSSTTDVRLVTGDIIGDLENDHLYQFQAEATGGSTSDDFIVVREAKLIVEQ